MPINLSPYGKPGRSLLGDPAIDASTWQYQPTSTSHDPNPPLTLESGGAVFPTQYSGLRAYYGAAVRELCLVAEADAPSGMGGVLKVLKGGVNYAVYLVETSDPNATPIRVRTSTGTKAVRIKT